jgi:hypothetical protein
MTRLRCSSKFILLNRTSLYSLLKNRQTPSRWIKNQLSPCYLISARGLNKTEDLGLEVRQRRAANIERSGFNGSVILRRDRTEAFDRKNECFQGVLVEKINEMY